MADETKKTDAVQTVFDQVTSSVDTAVAEGSAGLKDKIVRKLADEELGKRSELLLAGIRKFAETKGELDRVKRDFAKVNKPDVFENELDPAGAFIRKGKFSDAKVKEIAEATKKNAKLEKEINDKLVKLEGALSKAVNEADYAVLKKIINGKAEDKSDAAVEPNEQVIGHFE